MKHTIERPPVELARVELRREQLALPLESAEQLMARIDIPWVSLEYLFEKGFVSVLPEPHDLLSPSLAAEISFTCALVKSGLDTSSMANLLGKLTKPYSYDLSQLSFDWSKSAWVYQPIPRYIYQSRYPSNPNAAYDVLDLEWFIRLDNDIDEMDTLVKIRNRIDLRIEELTETDEAQK